MNENESWNGWKLYCYMCGHFWTVRNDKPPRTCPWCRSSRYDTPIKGSTNVPTAGTSGLSDRSQTSAPNADMPSACSPIPRYATAPQTLDLFEKYGVFGFLEEPALQWQSIDNTVLDINEYIGADAGTYFSASERGLFPCLAHGALVGYGEGINEATEKILNTVSKVTVERFLDGKQEYLDPGAC